MPKKIVERVAELADALASGASESNLLRVQLPPRSQFFRDAYGSGNGLDIISFVEKFDNLPPVERLRQHLIEDAKRASSVCRLRRWPKRPTRELALGMQNIFALFGNLNSDKPEYRTIANNFLEKRAEIYGFASVDELKATLVQLREELRNEMPEDKWIEYFGDTADFN